MDRRAMFVDAGYLYAEDGSPSDRSSPANKFDFGIHCYRLLAALDH